MVNEPTSAFPEVPGGSSGTGGWAPPAGSDAPDAPAPEPGPAPVTLSGLGSPTPPRTLTGWLPMAIGILFVFLGALWTLQGSDILTGSKMSGVSAFVVGGPVVSLVGLALVVLGVRRRSRSKRRQA